MLEIMFYALLMFSTLHAGSIVLYDAPEHISLHEDVYGDRRSLLEYVQTLSRWTFKPQREY